MNGFQGSQGRGMQMNFMRPPSPSKLRLPSRNLGLATGLSKNHFFVLRLQHYNGILLDIRHIDGLPFGNDIWMLLHHQPTYVREEETSMAVMWIGIRFAILMLSLIHI